MLLVIDETKRTAYSSSPSSPPSRCARGANALVHDVEQAAMEACADKRCNFRLCYSAQDVAIYLKFCESPILKMGAGSGHCLLVFRPSPPLLLLD